MKLVNKDKIKEIKKSMSYKMRIPPELLAKLAHNKGKIGKLAAKFDSWQSRTLDKNNGVYKDL